MATQARDGSGTTITFATSGYTADVLSIDGPTGVREAIDTTVLADDAEMTFIPAKLIDLGELTLEIEHEGVQDWILDDALEVIGFARKIEYAQFQLHRVGEYQPPLVNPHWQWKPKAADDAPVLFRSHAQRAVGLG